MANAKKNSNKRRRVIARVLVAGGIILSLVVAGVIYVVWSFEVGLSKKPSYSELVSFRKDDVLNARKDTLLLLKRQVASLGLEKVGVRNEMVTDTCRVKPDVYVLSPKLFKTCQIQEVVLITSPSNIEKTEHLITTLLNEESLKTTLTRVDAGCRGGVLTSANQRSFSTHALEGSRIRIGSLGSCGHLYETSFSGDGSYEWSVERIKSFNEAQIRKGALDKGEKSLIALVVTMTYFNEVMWE